MRIQIPKKSYSIHEFNRPFPHKDWPETTQNEARRHNTV